MSWGDFVKPVRLGKLATPEAEALARSLVEAETLPASPDVPVESNDDGGSMTRPEVCCPSVEGVGRGGGDGLR